ncbi:MAG TPA: phosphoglucomutase/phosphomannomutase family protein [Candidatus Micrarchaeia archaeon]|nr:phosphoglucomutase/phosphomannomutase family protein [Candidatus Micrarchaeia archaeon]
MAAERISFGTDGWRAVVADDFTYASVRAVSQGVAAFLADVAADRQVVVGHDTRFSAELFAREVARVLAANGRRVLLLDGPAPTQVAAWTVVDRHAAGGVVVTASHNPPEFNGLKYKPDYGGSAGPEVVARLEEETARAQAGVVRTMPFEAAMAAGLVEMVDPLPAYRAQVARMVDGDAIRARGLRIVHDAMYGSGAGYVASLLEGGATTVTGLHQERNPGFGGLHPEPIAVNLGAAIAAMRAGGFDLGIANDGDADRVGILDESGRFVNQLEVAALLMWHLCEQRGWRGPVVRSITSSSMLDRLGERYGCPVEELPVGFKYLGPRMREVDAILGAEESGGFGVRGHLPERDGILSGLLIAEMVVQAGRPLSALLAHVYQLVGPHAYARRDVRFERDGYPKVRQALDQRLAHNPPATIAGEAVVRSRTDDGFKYWFADGSWVLVRMSGTEPLMRVYSEASDDARVDRLIAAAAELAQADRPRGEAAAPARRG